MSVDSEHLARRFLQAWNAGGAHIVDELATPDLIVSYTHFPGPLRGTDAFKAALQQTHTIFPDLRIEPEELLVDGDRAVVRWTYRATHRAGKLFGVEASGRRVEVRGITLYRFRAGRVEAEEGVVDNLGLMAGLGADLPL